VAASWASYPWLPGFPPHVFVPRHVYSPKRRGGSMALRAAERFAMPDGKRVALATMSPLIGSRELAGHPSSSSSSVYPRAARPVPKRARAVESTSRSLGG